MDGLMQYLGQFMLKAVLVVAAYFAPCQEVVAIVFVFWLTDLVLGILASKRRQAPRSSRRLRKSVGKLIGYMSVILLAYLIDRLIGNSWIIPHRLMAAYLCACELISILENFAIISNNKAFVSLIKLIRGQNDENVIYDLIKEKNGYNRAARPAFYGLRRQPTGDPILDNQPANRYGNRDGDAPRHSSGASERPVDDSGATGV